MTVQVTLRYELVPEWEHLPAGMTHRDVPGVAVDSHDRVFLFTRHQPRVLVYERDGRFVTSWENLPFKSCHGLTIGPDDSVYLVDNVGHGVSKYAPSGERLLTIGPEGVPSETGYNPEAGDHAARTASIQRGAGPYNQPTNLAVAPNGDLYITDGYRNARVHQYRSDGTYVRSWGGPGSGPGQFMLPHGIAVAPDGTVLVADRENERIQFFSPDGEYLREWREVQRPTQVRLDREGRVYVSELWWRPGFRSFLNGPIGFEREGRVSVFSPAGELLVRLGGAESLAGIEEPGRFTAPHDIAVDSHGDIYVGEVTYADFGSQGLVSPDCHALQKFARR